MGRVIEAGGLVLGGGALLLVQGAGVKPILEKCWFFSASNLWEMDEHVWF